MRIDSFIITLLLITTVIVLGLGIVNDQATQNTLFVDNGTFANLTNMTNKLYQESSDMQTELKTPIGEAEVFGFLLKGGKQFLDIVWNVITIPGEILGNVGQLIGIPQILITMGTTALLIMVGFAIVYMFFRFQNR